MGVDWNVKPYHLLQLLVLTSTVELYVSNVFSLGFQMQIHGR